MGVPLSGYYQDPELDIEMPGHDQFAKIIHY